MAQLTSIEKFGACAILGGVVGGLTGVGVAAYGGYEIGTAINNYIGLAGSAGRFIVDAVVICTAMGPCAGIGAWTGGLAGAGVGLAYALVTGVSKPKKNHVNLSNSRARTYENRTHFEALSNPLRNIKRENGLRSKNTDIIQSQDNPEDLGSKINELTD